MGWNVSLQRKQAEFAKAAATLILKAFDMGYSVTLGDCYRDQRCGYGSPSSKHRRRLAIDLNLFSADGRYLTATEDHAPLGEWWERTYPENATWGGRFNDGNHYEWS